MHAKEYDFIFLGAGCASLSIVMRMITSGKFQQKKILLLEKEPKIKNDRTWCFWEKEPGFFDDIVYRKWSSLFFKSDDLSIPLEMDSYQYKMIRGIDFYNKCFSAISQAKNVDIIYGGISLQTDKGLPIIKINEEHLDITPGAVIFNSLYVPPVGGKKAFYLLQHFKGWVVQAAEGRFETEQATLMDFRVPQQTGTTFVYVLPLSSSKALVEYTLFTERLLPAAEYDKALGNYIEEFLKPGDYKVIGEEFGVIPMTSARFSFFKNGMFHIGTAGGQTKPSTGYTFRFIQKQADSIVEELISTGRPSGRNKTKSRFAFYDNTLLHILSRKLLEGKVIFSTLFKKNKASKVLKFLDNETTISEEMHLLRTLPKKAFINAGFAEFLKMVNALGKK